MKDGSASLGRKPDWLKVKIPAGENWRHVSRLLAERGLVTVCDSAKCPNKAECWGASTATFMVLGSVCTRACRFCAVSHAAAGESVRAEEPHQLAEAVAELSLKYAVVTSVDRDDLADRGAAHFGDCVRAIKSRNPGVRVEVLIPDYREGEIESVLAAGPDVVAHNLETIRRLQGVRDRRASYEASLRTLKLAASAGVSAGGRAPLVKSSLLLGLGESREEVLAAMDDLVAAGCTSLVLGQYLRPTAAQIPVVSYVSPEAFDDYAAAARSRGFVSVVASPLARTSYHARAVFEEAAPSVSADLPARG
jgi:lipoic acid synthetase